MYKLLLCWRYLRTRYIALASIISVMLGVATMIVVNSVMAGFTHEMQNRIHGILSDVVIESHSLEGFHDPEWHMQRIRQIAGKYVEGMTPTVVVPAMLNFQVRGQWITRPVSLIGVEEATHSKVSDFSNFLQHPENRKSLSFKLRDGGYDIDDHQARPGAKGPQRIDLQNAGWPLRRYQAAQAKRFAEFMATRSPGDAAAAPTQESAPNTDATPTETTPSETTPIKSTPAGEMKAPAESREKEIFGDEPPAEPAAAAEAPPADATASQPAVSQPAVSQPAVSQPAVSEPKAIQASASQASATEAEATAASPEAGAPNTAATTSTEQNANESALSTPSEEVARSEGSPEAEVAPSDHSPAEDPFRARNPFGAAAQNVFDPGREQHTGIVLGISLASFRTSEGQDRFMVLPGQDVKLTLPTAGTPPKAVTDNFTIVDFYESKMSEYDSNFVFAPIERVQQLRGMIDPQSGIGNVTSIQIKLHSEADGPMVRDLLRKAFPMELYSIQTWRDKQGALLAAVSMETAILNVLLFLIIAVAGFGILAIFYMIVVEKTKDIGVLKALGAHGRGIMGIFLGYGVSLGAVGSGVGMVLGLLFVANINSIAKLLAKITGHEVFDPSIYYFQEIPTIVEPFTVMWIVGGAIAIAVTAGVLPAYRAAGLHPVEALRYE